MIKLMVSLLGLFCFSVSASQSYNIYAILSADADRNMESISNTLHKYHLQSFYHQGKKVHATLYLTQFSENEMNRIQEIVQKIASNKGPFDIYSSGISKTLQNWLFVDISYSKELQRLSDIITLELSPLRDPNVLPPTWLKEYPQKLKAFERYGSPNVFQNFEPHLTLLANADAQKLDLFMDQEAKKLAMNLISMKVVGIGIAQTDNNGQIAKIISEYALKEYRDRESKRNRWPKEYL